MVSKQLLLTLLVAAAASSVDATENLRGLASESTAEQQQQPPPADECKSSSDCKVVVDNCGGCTNCMAIPNADTVQCPPDQPAKPCVTNDPCAISNEHAFCWRGKCVLRVECFNDDECELVADQCGDCGCWSLPKSAPNPDCDRIDEAGIDAQQACDEVQDPCVNLEPRCRMGQCDFGKLDEGDEE